MGDRIDSIDSGRAIAVMAVVAIHAEPFGGLGAAGNATNFVVDAVARFAVPFFFLTAGYLFAAKIASCEPRAYYRRYASRVASIYVLGLCIYVPLVLARAAGAAAVDGRSVQAALLSRTVEAASPLDLLYYGDSVVAMLWFLPALLVSITLVYLFERLDRRRYLLPAALGLHVVGILGESYPMVLDLPVATRDALFFGFAYTALGFWIRSRAWNPSRHRSHRYLAGFVAFTTLAVVERFLLGYVIGDATFAESVYAPEYSVTTLFATVSLFAFVLSRTDLGTGTSLPRQGRYAVGVYVVHPFVLYSLVGASHALASVGPALHETVLWHLCLTPVVYASSLLVYRRAVSKGVVDPDGSHVPALRRLRRAAVAVRARTVP